MASEKPSFKNAMAMAANVAYLDLLQQKVEELIMLGWFKPRVEKSVTLGWCVKHWTPNGPVYVTYRAPHYGFGIKPTFEEALVALKHVLHGDL